MGRNIGVIDISSTEHTLTLALRRGLTHCTLAHSEVRVLIRTLEQAITKPGLYQEPVSPPEDDSDLA